jgi:hypothetical protein
MVKWSLDGPLSELYLKTLGLAVSEEIIFK